ncbi:DUF7344 domain-containing protein [Halorussus halophilus]|uniref:DUF7344 domain-containing protein n=1 Tax=Halorussus halophilus TaxID=2650975 RepID=UPI001788657E|nr:hypothetical protein [Halorussus halophilus]
MSAEATPSPSERRTNGESDTPADLSTDQTFHLLQTQRRRDALWYLKQHDGPVEMSDMAEQVAAWEYDTTVPELHSNQRQRVYIGLYQTHLPKLDQAGVIDYNQSRGIVERTPLAEEFDAYLEEIYADSDQRNDDDADASDGRWFNWRQGTTLFGAGAFTTFWLNLFQFGSVYSRALGVVLSLALVVLTVFQYAPKGG